MKIEMDGHFWKKVCWYPKSDRQKYSQIYPKDHVKQLSSIGIESSLSCETIDLISSIKPKYDDKLDSCWLKNIYLFCLFHETK